MRPTVAFIRLPHGRGIDLPAYETPGAAGMDLRAAVPDDAVKSGFYKALPFYKPMTIPAGTYKDVGVCKSFQDATFLTVHKDIPDELVYKVASLLWSEEGMKEMTTRKKTFKSMTMENNFKGASVPLHAGAVKFWEEKGVKVPDALK